MERSTIRRPHCQYPSHPSPAFPDFSTDVWKAPFRDSRAKSDHAYVDVAALVFGSAESDASTRVAIARIEAGAEVLPLPLSFWEEGVVS